MDRKEANAQRVLKSCDACSARKVRCSRYPGPCTSCIRRKIPCSFSPAKRPRRCPATKAPLSSTFRLDSPEEKPTTHTPLADNRNQNNDDQHCNCNSDGVNLSSHSAPSLYIDYVLAQAPSATSQIETKLFQGRGNGIFNDSFNSSFFSESRLLSLSTRLKNDSLNDLLRRATTVLNARLKPMRQVVDIPLPQTKMEPGSSSHTFNESLYVKSYFTHVHPLFPFLDQPSFESAVFGPDASQLLSRNKAWSALYHGILALGCQYHDRGSFEPGRGKSWSLFSTSLALFPDLLILPESAVLLQALAAMSIYALSLSCMQIERVIISEAARKVQDFGRSRPASPLESQPSPNVFWVIYSVEKLSSFFSGRSSVFIDSEIGYPVPATSIGLFKDFDWFITFVRYARILSKTYTSLFSIGVTQHDTSYFVGTINHLRSELEQWRLSIPLGIRPNEPFDMYAISGTQSKTAAIWVRYLYLYLLLILERALLHVEWKVPDRSKTTISSSTSTAVSRDLIMEIARSILELTKYIDVEPYTPFWLIAGIPAGALFVLFDMLIHDPKHPKTGWNLAILDVAGGHFSRLEYMSGGSLPGSMITEFASIARNFVRSVHQTDRFGDEGITATTMLLPVLNSKDSEALAAQTGFEVGMLSGQTDQNIVQHKNGCVEAVDTFTLFRDNNDAQQQIDYGFPDGTDLMDLFTSALPDMDPLLWPWVQDGSGFMERVERGV